MTEVINLVLQDFPWVSLYVVVFGLSDVVWAYRHF